jgi:hypothetical protein
MSHHRPPICLRGVLEGCLGACDSGRFDFCLSLRSKEPPPGNLTPNTLSCRRWRCCAGSKICQGLSFIAHLRPYERAGESVRAKQTHCGPKFRFVPAAATCAKASRQLVEGHIWSTWRHTKFPDRSRLVHTAASRRLALSSGEANGWFLAKDLRMAGPGNNPVQVLST